MCRFGAGSGMLTVSHPSAPGPTDAHFTTVVGKLALYVKSALLSLSTAKITRIPAARAAYEKSPPPQNMSTNSILCRTPTGRRALQQLAAALLLFTFYIYVAATPQKITDLMNFWQLRGVIDGDPQKGAHPAARESGGW